MQNVTTHEHQEIQYKLLQPGSHPARTGPNYQVLASWHQLPDILAQVSRSEFVAVDFETRGNDYSLVEGDSELLVVGIGLAWDTGSAYLHWTGLSPINRHQLLETIGDHQGTLCHNMYFDGGVYYKYTQKHLYGYCTYSLAAHTANESPEQRWGLKHLMVSLLGWTSSNESELDQWLVQNGHYKGVKLTLDGVKEVGEWYWDEGMQRFLKPEKGEMWRAPAPILGKYCVLDAEATYLLFQKVLEPVLQAFPGLQKQQWELMHLIRQLIEQKMGGIDIDIPALRKLDGEVLVGMQEGAAGILSDTRTKPYIQAIEWELLQEYKLKEPEKYLKQKEQKEPERLRKDGSIYKNWVKWNERDTSLVISKNWQTWNDKYHRILAGELPEYKFNVNSDHHLRTLLYDRMGFEKKILTDKGLGGTSAKALQGMGEVGEMLIQYNYLQKESGFLQGYLSRVQQRPTIHPSLRTPGTVTGRLSSKDPNLQQVPKTKRMMSLFRARPGTVWADIDFAAVESVIAAEFSQDPNMLALYGDGVAENDIHLFVAASVPGEMGDAVLRTGYRPIDPPPGSVSLAKKQAKHWRNIAKTVVYACQFGAGVNKVLETLEADNVFLPYDQVEVIHSAYWNTFAQLKDFGKSLYFEWRRNKGYILNGLGRPMAVADGYTKDLLSRFIQSTGHDILIKYVYIMCDLLAERGIPYRPVIIDFHDATTVEVPEAYGQQTIDVMNDAMTILNQQLNGTIRMRGIPTIGTTLADVKEPES